MNCVETMSCVLRRGVPSGVDDRPTSTVLISAPFAWLALQFSDLAPGLWSGARYRCDGQIDLIAPRVPPRELRERVLPARREILHFLKTAPREKFAFRLKSGLASTLLIDWPPARERRRCRTPRLGQHCCFLTITPKLPACCPCDPVLTLSGAWPLLALSGRARVE